MEKKLIIQRKHSDIRDFKRSDILIISEAFRLFVVRALCSEDFNFVLLKKMSCTYAHFYDNKMSRFRVARFRVFISFQILLPYIEFVITLNSLFINLHIAMIVLNCCGERILIVP